MGFVGIGLKIPNRLAVISGERKDPKVASQTRRGINVKQETSVRRPVVGKLRLARLEQKIFLARAARILLIQIERAVPVGSKDDVALVRRPNGLPVDRGTKGDLRAGVPREFVHPEVLVWYSAAYFLRANPTERHTSSIGREGHSVVVPWLADGPESLPSS